MPSGGSVSAAANKSPVTKYEHVDPAPQLKGQPTSPSISTLSCLILKGEMHTMPNEDDMDISDDINTWGMVRRTRTVYALLESS